jgi:hypothetical protein
VFYCYHARRIIYFYLQSAHAKAGLIKLNTLKYPTLMFLLTLPFIRRVRKTVKSAY